MPEGNYNFHDSPAFLLRTSSKLKQLPIGSIVFNRSAMTSGGKAFLRKIAADVWTGVNESDVYDIASRPPRTLIEVGNFPEVDYQRNFPSENILMPCWIYFKPE